MRAIDRKLLRNLFTMKGQVLAIVLIVTCGVASFVTVLTAYQGLRRSRASYYRNYRMADLFAPVKRAPRSVLADLERVPGVRRVEGRIVFDVVLDLPDTELPCSGRVISVPDRRRGILNDLHVTAGRWFDGDGTRQVIVAERFASEHGLRVGDTLAVVMNNRKEALRIVATALSPEFVYLIRGGGEMLPDARHFTVLWMAETFTEAVFGFASAINDVVATLQRDTRLEEVIDAFDLRLDRYGALGAFGRKDQLSHRSLNDEIEGLRGSATMTPTLFLAVAAFVLNMLMRRLVQTQRGQISLMRALGYGTADVVGHYLKLALLVGALGAALGTALGLWLAHGLAEMYRAFFSFPALTFVIDGRVIAGGWGASLLFAVLGALGAVRAAARLAPAEGLHPESPRLYRRTFLEAWPALWRHLGFTLRMVLRHLARTKLRAAVTMTGVALSASILLLAFFGRSTLDALMDHQFRLVQRDDIRVTFHEERGPAALYGLRRMAGVRTAEGEYVLPVRMVNGWRERRTGIIGLEPHHSLHALLDEDLQPVPLPGEGLLLSSKLAELLAVRPGDALRIEALTGRKRTFTVPVARVVEEYLGTSAYAEAGRLARWAGEGPRFTGAMLDVDPALVDVVGRRLKDLPAVASVSVKDRTIRSFMETIAASQGIMTTILILFAGVITFGVIYNAARISLSERQRELGSLRVLGFTHGEVAAVLSTENVLLSALALVPGIPLGLWLCWLLTRFYETDLYRFPFVVRPDSMLATVVAVLVFALLANLAVQRRLRRLDLVEVLKERE